MLELVQEWWDYGIESGGKDTLCVFFKNITQGKTGMFTLVSAFLSVKCGW